jgi:hypothetical protein
MINQSYYLEVMGHMKDAVRKITRHVASKNMVPPLQQCMSPHSINDFEFFAKESIPVLP